MRNRVTFAWVPKVLVVAAILCHGIDATGQASVPPQDASAPSPAPSPYALPFQLRPAIAPNGVRVEETLDAFDAGFTSVSIITAAVRLGGVISPLIRAGYVAYDPSGASVQGAMPNPVVGVLFTPELARGLRLGVYTAVAIPLGQGEGEASSAPEMQALAAGRIARSDLDNPMFATNYTTAVIGMSLAWLVRGFTFQLDATYSGGIRSRPPTSADAAVGNFTCGAWVGYAITSSVFVGAEIRRQQFLTTPALVRTMGDIARGQTSVALGARVRIPLSGPRSVSIGVAYVRGLDGLMANRADNVILFDIPLAL